MLDKWTASCRASHPRRTSVNDRYKFEMTDTFSMVPDKCPIVFLWVSQCPITFPLSRTLWKPFFQVKAAPEHHCVKSMFSSTHAIASLRWERKLGQIPGSALSGTARLLWPRSTTAQEEKRCLAGAGCNVNIITRTVLHRLLLCCVAKPSLSFPRPYGLFILLTSMRNALLILNQHCLSISVLSLPSVFSNGNSSQ